MIFYTNQTDRQTYLRCETDSPDTGEVARSARGGAVARRPDEVELSGRQLFLFIHTI